MRLSIGFRQNEFYMAETNESLPSHLIERFNDRKGISLFFHGIENVVTLKNGKKTDFQNYLIEFNVFPHFSRVQDFFTNLPKVLSIIPFLYPNKKLIPVLILRMVQHIQK